MSTEHHTHNPLLLTYHTIQERNPQDSYAPRRTLYSPQKEKAFLPLKKFQEYFGKEKPSFFCELKNIFTNSTIDDRRPFTFRQEPLCHVQGALLSARGRYLKRKQQPKSQLNNFTIESIKTKDFCKKAKLNHLLALHDHLTDSTVKEEEAANIIRKSGKIIRQLKEAKVHRRISFTPSQKGIKASRIMEKQLLLTHLNPCNKDEFTVSDLHRAIATLHQTKIRVSPNISYFNVFIEEGNNSELLKMLARRRTGWRVVEIPAIANLIWTQFYKKSALKNRLNKKEKTEIEIDEGKTSQSKATFKASISKSTDSDCNTPLLKQSDSNFPAEIRKLIPLTEAEDISKIKVTSNKNYQQISISHNVLLHNHFPSNRCISDKKNLLANLNLYFNHSKMNVFDYLPESYQVLDLSHPIIQQLQENPEKKEHWILKPGENSNRGRGIIVTHSKGETLQELKKRLDLKQSKQTDSPQRKKGLRSIVLQRYLNPLLYNNRKFDVRYFMLVTLLNKQLRVYCYDECYIRTSSKIFDIESTSKFVHLTNDAVQSQSNDYGKYEEGNKVSETIFSRFIDEEHQRQGKVGPIWAKLKKQMENRCIDVIKSSYRTLASGCNLESDEQEEENSERKTFYFELFGLDFMIDQEFKLWLIEVNTNPAITHDCSKVLNLLIPKMLDNAMTLAIEPIMKPIRTPQAPFTNRFTAVLTENIS